MVSEKGQSSGAWYAKAEFIWYKNAKLNITKNCIDRHLANTGEEKAIIFKPNNPDEEPKHYTYLVIQAHCSILKL